MYPLRKAIVNSKKFKKLAQMNNLKLKLLSLMMGLLVFCVISVAQIPNDIVSSIQTGSDAKLAAYFNENVELVVGTHDDVYSKQQAQQIVAEFFKSNKPKQFSIIHEGGKEDSRYAIGSMVTATGTFRVYILTRVKGNSTVIHQLKIEKQG
jgi:hypothetical protein